MANKVIFFDGVCNLCSGFVQFIIKLDKKKQFSFAALQSKYAQDALQSHNLNSDELQSVIFIINNKVYTKSDAAIEIAKQLGGLWFLVRCLKVFPLRFRNLVYDFIGKNRYKWFGKKESCMVPSEELKSRFL
ncbi:MAG: thiol-disulfide oxidoreductase DCC family protein [Sphingobacteriales bacterium]|nr:MAG: thiol-disulfide oxidoreductase DCC family protein [Sphingobacteriales bacterium]